MDWAEVLPNAVLCAAALVVVACLPVRERAVGLICAAVVSLDWLLYVLSWTPWSLRNGFALLGADVPGTTLWPIIDGLAAAAIVTVGYEHRTAWAVWALLSAQIVFHIFYQLKYIQFGVYSHYLDGLFWAQIACFILWGAPHVGNRLARLVARFQLSGRPGSPSHARAPR